MSIEPLLARLEQAWLTHGWPEDYGLAPGLTEVEIRALLAPLTGSPPPAIIEWFSWHNGASDVRPVFWLAPSGYEPLALKLALDVRQRALVLSAEQVDGPFDPAEAFLDRWLPIGGASMTELAVNLIDAPGDPAGAVHAVSWDDLPAQKVSDSLEEALGVWLSTLEGGHWRWNDRRRLWDVDFPAVPLELRRWPLIG